MIFFTFFLAILIRFVQGDQNFSTSTLTERGNQNVTSGTCRGAANTTLSTSIDNLAKVIEETQRSIIQSQNYQSARTGKSLHLDSNLTEMELPTISEEVDGLKSLVSQLQSEVRRLQESERSRVFFSVATSKKFKCSECVVTYNIDHAIFPPGCVNMVKGTFIAPSSGFYFFQFHAMVEPHKVAKVQMLINGNPVAHMYDRDVGGKNNRFAMIGQSVIHRMSKGDSMHVKLHEGGLKGGPHFSTSLVGMKVGHEDPATLV